MLPENERKALHDFQIRVEEMGLSCLIVGAGARLLTFDWRYRTPPGRSTTDWDFAIRVEQWQDYSALIEGLCSGHSPVFRRDRSEHRCVHISTQTAIDIVPFGTIGEPNKEIAWPIGEGRMNVMGYEEALTHAEEYDIDGVRFKVVNVPAFVALKLLTWGDRKADKDLKDIDHVLVHYLDVAIEQIYADLDNELVTGKVEYEDAGPYHLGWQMARMFPEDVRVHLAKIIDQLLDGQDRYITGLLRPAYATVDYEERFDAVVKRLHMLSQGLRG